MAGNGGKATAWTALGSAKLPDLAELEQPAEPLAVPEETSPEPPAASAVTESVDTKDAPIELVPAVMTTAVNEPQARVQGRARKPKKPEVMQKAEPWERFTVNLRPDLIDKVRDACWWSRLSVAGFITDAIGREIRRLERERNEGKPFPPREGELKKGPGIR